MDVRAEVGLERNQVVASALQSRTSDDLQTDSFATRPLQHTGLPKI